MHKSSEEKQSIDTVNLNLTNDSTLNENKRMGTISIVQHKYAPSMFDETSFNNDDENINSRFKYHDYYNKKQIRLLNVTSRVALTSFIAMISSLIYQLIWLIGLELNNYSHLVWFNYTWCLDGIITIICVYLQISIAKPRINGYV